jgi:hypothetical protein
LAVLIGNPSQADIVTFNVRDFKETARFEVRAFLKPSEVLKMLKALRLGQVIHIGKYSS